MIKKHDETMRIKINKYLPPHGFVAMAVYGTIFWRKEYEDRLEDEVYYYKVYNHESIHEAQMRDFCKWLCVGGTVFYVLYFLEWLFRVLFTKDFMSRNAYKNLSFEKEAKSNENDLNYLHTRKKFAQWK